LLAARGTPFVLMLTANSPPKSHSHIRTDIMDKLVRRVTVVQGHDAKLVYQSEDDFFDSEGKPNLKKLEEGVRHMLKAQVIVAQEAYDRHLESAKKDGNAWLTDVPANFMKARKKAIKEMRDSIPKEIRKRVPFGLLNDDDDKED
jgi:hypothetical protein